MMGILFLGLGAAVIASQPSVAARLADLAERRSGPFPAPVLMLAVGVLLLWTLVGAFLGIVFVVVSQVYQGSGLGSPNVLYTLVVLVFSFLPMLLTLFFSRKHIVAAIALAAGSAAIFGWLLPWLAS